MIKAAFFDFDGTFYSHNTHCVPKETLEAVRLLKEKNIMVVLNTGRHTTELNFPEIQDVGFDGFICCNGQLVFDKDMNLIYDNPIPQKDLDFIVEQYNKKEIPICMFTKDDSFVNFLHDDILVATSAIQLPVPKVKAYEGETVYIAYYPNRDNSDYFRKHLDLEFSRWCDYFEDMFTRGGGKGIGIKKFIEHYGIKQEETIAFGDGDNDCDMLRYAHIGVAPMISSFDCLLSADYVTSDIDDGGILSALKHFEIV